MPGARTMPPSVRTAAKPAPPIVAEPNLVTPPLAPPPPPKQDAWRAHDTVQQTMYVPGALASDSVMPSRFSKRFRLMVRIGIFGASIAGAFTAAQYVPGPAFLFSRTGTLVIESKPDGVPLLVDGQPQGVTPVTLQLGSGKHEVELRGGGKPRIFSVFISRGARISQYIEMPASRGRSAQPYAPPPAIAEPAAPMESLPAQPAPAQPIAAQPMSAPISADPGPSLPVTP